MDDAKNNSSSSKISDLASTDPETTEERRSVRATSYHLVGDDQSLLLEAAEGDESEQARERSSSFQAA